MDMDKLFDKSGFGETFGISFASPRHIIPQAQHKMGHDMIRRAFTQHPASVGESYFEHFVHASGFGFRMILGGIACMLHGVLPFLFVKTGSKQIETLHGRMVVNRSKLPQPIDFVI